MLGVAGHPTAFSRSVLLFSLAGFLIVYLATIAIVAVTR